MSLSFTKHELNLIIQGLLWRLAAANSNPNHSGEVQEINGLIHKFSRELRFFESQNEVGR